jgi:hypothetical protein
VWDADHVARVVGQPIVLHVKTNTLANSSAALTDMSFHKKHIQGCHQVVNEVSGCGQIKPK